MPETEDSHQKLLGAAILLVIGLTVLGSGVASLSWVVTLLGAAISAVGGYEVRDFYLRIEYENKSARARQSGTGNVQTTQSNPKNSPVIHAKEVYFGTSQPKVRQKTATRSMAATSTEVERLAHEWVINGEVRFEDYEEFKVKLSRGDQLKGPVKSDDPISIKIMDDDNFEAFEEDDTEDNYDTLWESPVTTDYYVSYTATARRPIHLVIRDEEERDYDEETSVNARIEVIKSTAS